MRLNINKRTIHDLLKESGLGSYHRIPVQQLFPQDRLARVNFCHVMNNKVIEVPNIYDRIIWSDEAKIHSNYIGNQRNNTTWAYDNPKELQEKPLKSEGASVWVSFYSGGIIGHYFFDGTVNGERYLEMLRNYAIPKFQEVLGENWREYWFMQDGAPAHFQRDVREFLNENFAGWIGRGGGIAWPPRSPDLNPLDYFFWGYLKPIIAKSLPKTRQEIIEKFEEATAIISPEMIADACHALPNRIRICLEHNGGHLPSTNYAID